MNRISSLIRTSCLIRTYFNNLLHSFETGGLRQAVMKDIVFRETNTLLKLYQKVSLPLASNLISVQLIQCIKHRNVIYRFGGKKYKSNYENSHCLLCVFHFLYDYQTTNANHFLSFFFSHSGFRSLGRVKDKIFIADLNIEQLEPFELRQLSQKEVREKTFRFEQKNKICIRQV